MPLLTETCGFLPSPEAARVAWAWAPTPLLFCPLKSQSWLEKVFTSVFWQRHSLSHWGHLGKWTPSAADSYSTPAWVHAGTSHVVRINTSGRYQTSARCPIAQGYHLRKLEGWLYSALGWGLLSLEFSCHCRVQPPWEGMVCGVWVVTEDIVWSWGSLVQPHHLTSKPRGFFLCLRADFLHLWSHGH